MIENNNNIDERTLRIKTQMSALLSSLEGCARNHKGTTDEEITNLCDVMVQLFRTEPVLRDYIGSNYTEVMKRSNSSHSANSGGDQVIPVNGSSDVVDTTKKGPLVASALIEQQELLNLMKNVLIDEIVAYMQQCEESKIISRNLGRHLKDKSIDDIETGEPSNMLDQLKKNFGGLRRFAKHLDNIFFRLEDDEKVHHHKDNSRVFWLQMIDKEDDGLVELAKAIKIEKFDSNSKKNLLEEDEAAPNPKTVPRTVTYNDEDIDTGVVMNLRLLVAQCIVEAGGSETPRNIGRYLQREDAILSTNSNALVELKEFYGGVLQFLKRTSLFELTRIHDGNGRHTPIAKMADVQQED